MSTNIGALEGTITFRDEFTSKIEALASRVSSLEQKITSSGRKITSEADKIAASYKKLSSSLDPAVASHHRYESAVNTLSSALKHGIISQSEHNTQLGLARTKFLEAGDGAHKFSSLLSEVTRVANYSGSIAKEVAEKFAVTTERVAELGASAASLGLLSVAVIALAGAALGLGLAWKGIEFIFESVKEGIETQVIIDRLNSTLRATGSYARLSSKELLEYADSLVRLTGRSKDEIIGAETILARFHTLNSESLPKSIKLTLDYAQATGKTADEVARKLGPALEGNAKSLTSLKEIGIVFSKGQKDTLADMIKVGNIAGYQSIVFKALEQQVGGTAEAFGRTLKGGISIATQEYGLFKETIASEIIPALEDGLNGIVQQLGGWETLHKIVQSVAHDIGNFVREMVYGILLSYHEWMAGQYTTLANLEDGLKKFVNFAFDAAASIANAISKIPGPDQKTFSLAALQIRLYQTKANVALTAAAKDARQSANEQVKAYDQIGKALLKHRLALEGDDKVWKDHGSIVDDIAEKDKAAADAIKKITEALAELKHKAEAAIEAFRLVGATDAEILKHEIAEARYAAAVKLGNEATKAQISLAQKYAEEAAIATHATKNWEAALKDLDKAATDKVNAIFNDNAKRVEFQGPYQAGVAIDNRVVDQIFLKLKQRAEEFATGVKSSLLSIADSYKIEEDKIRAAVKRGDLTAKEGAEAVSRTEQQRWNETLDIADQALSYLSDRFGGFFSSIQKAVNALQGARGFGQSLSALASSNQNTAQYASAIGTVGTVFAAYYAIYSAISAHIKKVASQRFQLPVEFSLSGFTEAHSFFDEAGKQIAGGIRDLVRQIEDAVGILVQDLPTIGISVRKDGKKIKAFVEGQLIGVFDSVDEAVQAALLSALQNTKAAFSGLSDLMKEGLRVHVPDISELTRFLSQLREIGDLGLPQGAVQVRETIRHLDELWTALSRLREVTPAVTQGFANLINAQVNTFQQWRNQITGHQETSAELLARLQGEAKIFNAEKALRIADLQYREYQLKIEADQLRIRAQIGITGGRIGQQTLTTQIAELKVRTSIAEASKTLVETQLEMLDAMIKAIDDAISALQSIPDIQLPEIKIPNIGRGGGAGTGDNILDFINSKKFDLASSKLGEYQRKIAEVIKQYDEQIAQTGRDSAQRRELIALKNEELRQLAQERALTVVGSFQQFLGLVTPFDEVRKTAADLIAQIEDSPFGDARKARMIGRVIADLDRQLEQLANQSALNLFQDMTSDLEKFGASAQLQAEVQRNLVILEHNLKLAHYRTEIEILRAEGKLSAGVLATLDASLKFLEGIDPTALINAAVYTPVTQADIDHDKAMVAGTDAAKDLADALKSAKDKLKKYQDDGLDPLTSSLVQITTDFQEIRKALGSTPEILATESAAIKRAIDSFLEPIRQVQHDLLYGEQSVSDTLSKWGQVQVDFAKVRDRFHAGDLSVVKDVPDMVQQFLALAREVSPVGSEAYKTAFTFANNFLNEVLSITPDKLGSNSNPMSVAGMVDLTVLSEAQIDRLDKIYATNERMANAVDGLLYLQNYGVGPAKVA